jgi:hypothetical protein
MEAFIMAAAANWTLILGLAILQYAAAMDDQLVCVSCSTQLMEITVTNSAFHQQCS